MHSLSVRSKHLVVAIITTLIFVLGILVGNMLSEQKLGELRQLQQELRSDTLSFNLQQSLLSDSICKEDILKPTYKKLYELGSKLSTMEERLGSDHTEVMSLKRYYSLLEVQQWLTLKKLNSECENKNDNWILYFYSNDQEECPQCDRQGFILNHVRETVDDVKIFSFDADLDEQIVNTLKQAYNVTETPALVINGKTYKGFQTLEALRTALKNSTETNAPTIGNVSNQN